MKKLILFSGLFLIQSLFAQGKCEQGTVIPELKGILLLGDSNLVHTQPIDPVLGVESVGVALLEKNKKFLASLDQQFVGKPLTQTSLQELKQSIASYYESKNQPLVVISTPRQEVTKGILQLVVNEATLGEIRCKGNRYFTSKQLQRYIRAKEGAPIIAKELYEDLAFMNHNPFRRTDAVFTPGARPGIADLELLTVDRWPYRVYVGADNTGTIATERNRVFFGVNLGKTVIQDSEVSYQYTQAPNGNRFFSHTAFVRVPLPWFRHILQAYGGYANVQLTPKPEEANPPGTGTVQVKPRGINWDISLRYRFPLYTNLDFLQEIVAGYDYKEMRSNVKFNHQSAHEGTASINQFSVGYNVGLRNRSRKLFFNGEIFFNPSSITNNNNDESYKRLRNNARALYVYLKASHSLAQEFYGWWFSYDLSGQWSSTNLLPTEQFTMTGYNAVRGFEERILNLDNAGIMHLTIETPHVSPAQWFGWKKHYDELYVLAFFDTGLGTEHDSPNGSFASLGSIGPSLRYQYSHYISAHLDYGFQLWHSGFENITDSRYNFGATISY